MIGFIIGLVSGFAQFHLLSRYTRAVVGGQINTKLVLIGVLQFFIPLIILLGVAFLLPGELLWTGIGMAAALLGSAVVSFIRRSRNSDDGGK